MDIQENSLILGSYKGFPHSSVGEESACNTGDPDSIPGSRRVPGEGNSNPLQYSCLENPMDRGAGQAIVHGVARVRHDLATKERGSYKMKYLGDKRMMFTYDLLRNGSVKIANSVHITILTSLRITFISQLS